MRNRKRLVPRAERRPPVLPLASQDQEIGRRNAVGFSVGDLRRSATPRILPDATIARSFRSGRSGDARRQPVRYLRAVAALFSAVSCRKGCTCSPQRPTARCRRLTSVTEPARIGLALFPILFRGEEENPRRSAPGDGQRERFADPRARANRRSATAVSRRQECSTGSFWSSRGQRKTVASEKDARKTSSSSSGPRSPACPVVRSDATRAESVELCPNEADLCLLCLSSRGPTFVSPSS